MSNTDTATRIPDGNLAEARQFPTIVNGWYRETPWIDSHAGDTAGDYARGPALITYYTKWLADGSKLAVEIATYLEVRPDEEDPDEFPEAELFLTERCYYHSAKTPELFEGQWFDVEDYEYEPIDLGPPYPSLVEGEVTPEDAWKMLRRSDRDDREYLCWNGEPVRR